MPDTTTKTPAATVPPAAPPATVEAGVQAELARRDRITAAATTLGLADRAPALIESGASVEDAQTALLDAFVAIAGAHRAVHPRIEVGASAEDPAARMQARGEALACRMTGRAPSEAARPFAHLDAVGHAEDMLFDAGVRTRGLSRAQIIDAAFRPQAVHTTSDFPTLLEVAGSKMLLPAYEAAAPGLKRVSREIPARDFKTMHNVRLGAHPTLAEVKEAGPVTYATRPEMDETFSLKSFARSFLISYQALVNDDLGAFDEFARAAGIAAAGTEGSQFKALLALNGGLGPTLTSDSKTLFNADHGNYESSGAAPSVTTVGAARQAMREQKALDATTPIAAPPRYLVVPPKHETVAEQLVADLAPAVVSEANPFAGGRLEVVVDSWLSGDGWYVFADQAVLPVLQHAYLEGRTRPETAIENDFDTRDVKFRVWLDFGVGAVDYRGAYFNDGVT